MVNTVGAVYVKVISDSKGFAQALRRDAKKAGDEAGADFADNLNDKIEKRLRKVQIEEILGPKIREMGDHFAREVDKAQQSGSRFKVKKFRIEDFISFAELKDMADKIGVSTTELAKHIEQNIGGAFKNGFATMRKEQAQAIKDEAARLSKMDRMHAQALAEDIKRTKAAAKKLLTAQQQMDRIHAKALAENAKRTKQAAEKLVKERIAAEKKMNRIHAQALAEDLRRTRQAAEQASRDFAKRRPLFDVVDRASFQTFLRSSARDMESKLTPALRRALENGTRIDWSDYENGGTKAVKEIARVFRISHRDAGRELERELRRVVRSVGGGGGGGGRGIFARLFAGGEEVRDIVTRLDNSMDHLHNSLRRVGTGGAIDSVTNALGGILKMSYMAGKAIMWLATEPIKLLGKGLTKAAGLFESFAAKGGMLAKVFKPLAGLARGAGSAIAALFSNPITAAVTVVGALVAGLGVLSKVLGAMVTLAVDLGGMFAMLGAGIASAAIQAVVLAPVLASLGAGFGALILGGTGAAKAITIWAKAAEESDPAQKAALLKQYNEQLKKLGPNARAAVKAMQPMVTGFQKLRKEMGEKLFEGFGKALKNAEPLAKGFKDGMLGVADAVGDVIRGFLNLGKNKTFVADMNTLWKSAAVIIRDVGAAAKDVFAGIVAFFAIISPKTEVFSGGLRGIAESFREWTQSEEGRNRIKTWFDNVWIIGSKVWAILKEIGAVFGSLFNGLIGGATEGEGGGGETLGFLDTLLGKLENLRIWIDENSKNGNFKRWLSEARVTASTLWGALNSLGDMLRSLNTEENRAFARNLINAINGTIKAVNVLLGLGSSILGFAWNWIPTLSILKSIWEILHGKMPSAITNWKNLFVGAFNAVVGAVKNLIHWIGQIHFPGIPSWAKGIKDLANPFGAAGGVFSTPTTKIIGEAGPEALIPLTRPLRLVDPSVRPMAALLRGNGQAASANGSVTSAGKVINNYFTISTPSPDGRVVAAQVVNRMVAMAG